MDLLIKILTLIGMAIFVRLVLPIVLLILLVIKEEIVEPIIERYRYEHSK